MALSKTLHYLKNRLTEGSTWTGIAAAIVGGVALPVPYNHLTIIAGIFAALFPTTPKKEGCE